MQLQQELSGVNWSEKSVASGKADKVPAALAGLLSPDENLRNRSYWQLDNEIVLQSDLYEAAYFVIPFLIRCLSEKVAHGRDRIYDLLYEIAHGHAPTSLVCRTKEGDEISLEDACAREVNKGLEMYLRDTTDANPLIAEKAKELIELLKSNEQDNGDVARVRSAAIPRIRETDIRIPTQTGAGAV